MYDTTKPYTDQIRELVKQTWDIPSAKIEGEDHPTILQRNFSFPEVDHVDGIGTKGVYHWRNRTFSSAVQDALAMNFNDLAMMRARPYKLQDHLTLPEDDHGAILEIIQSLTEQCRHYRVAVTGGETSIHNNAEGLEISVVNGFITKRKPNRFRAGDMLIGIGSTGIHSNGFTRLLHKQESSGLSWTNF